MSIVAVEGDLLDWVEWAHFPMIKVRLLMFLKEGKTHENVKTIFAI